MNVKIAEPYDPSEYGDISCCDEATQKYFEENHDHWTLEQMNALRDYLDTKISALRKVAEENVTIEQFEDAKKEDIDNDNEEGEE